MSRYFLEALADDPPPAPAIEEIARMVMQVDCHLPPTDGEGRALVAMVQSQAEIWAGLSALCMAAGNAPGCLWPIDAVEAWIRLRTVFEAIKAEGISFSDHDEEPDVADVERTDALFRRGEREGDPISTAIVASAVGLVTYAAHRAELSGDECLADPETLRVALWVVLYCAEHYPESGSGHVTLWHHFQAIDRARARAEEDHREGRASPFEALSDWTLEAPKNGGENE